METHQAAPDGDVVRVGNLHHWNDVVSETFRGSSVDADSEKFDAELSVWEVEELRVVHVSSQPSTVKRWLYSGPRTASAIALLHLQVAGSSINEQRGRAVSLDPGDSTLCAADLRYTVEFPSPYRMFVLELPISRILASNPAFDLDGFAPQKLDPKRSRLLLSFLRAAWAERDCMLTDTDWRECVSRTTIDLAIRTITQTGGPCLVGAAAELRRDVIDLIRKNLYDPDLRTSSIATALGISSRSVQTVFERLATTASDYILEQRLRRAAERLREDQGRYSITALAFDCGFNDSAYFSRCFSRHYGLSPRQYRQLARAAPAEPILVSRRS